MRYLIIAAVSGVLAACSAGTTEPLTVTGGQIAGAQLDGYRAFRGIPYAAPPVGDARWRAPQALQPWEDVRAAKEYGPGCWQPAGTGNAVFVERLTEGAGMSWFGQLVINAVAGAAEADVSEDCLTLNVMTPDRTSEALLPVMFWIHGGGHAFGSGGTMYESASLVREGVVLVTINYRLGLYGFMGHPELAAEDPNGSTGNYGMLDQIAALEWVQQNIARFGGDPANVTIFGESAGGHSVGQLMASPLSRGLFHRAIAQSGSGFYQFQAAAAATERMSGFDAGHRVAEIAGVSGTNEIAALRALSPEELAAAATDPGVGATLHPQIDGYVLPSPTAAVFAAGAQHPVPLIVGSNADEGSVLYYLGLAPVDGGSEKQPQTVAEWEQTLTREFGAHAILVASAYPVEEQRQVVESAETLMTDTWFGRHAYYMAATHAQAGHPAYLYFYERAPASDTQTIGASHALEIGHVMGEGAFMPLWPTDERDAALSDEMRGGWAQFARTGNPNAAGLPEWPVFSPVQPMELAYGHERTFPRPVARADRYSILMPQFFERLKRAMIALEQPLTATLSVPGTSPL